MQQRERHPTVLIVDDDPDARSRSSDVSAADGREGLYLLTAMQALPSLILLDVKMPLMAGPEFLAVMRSYHRLSSIPVVLLTGIPGDHRELDCAAIVPKSAARDALLPTIQALGIRVAKGTAPP